MPLKFSVCIDSARLLSRFFKIYFRENCLSDEFLYLCKILMKGSKFQNMEIKKVISDKKEFLELLLLADEQESMIDRYLERGDMFVLYDNGLKACCVVTREGEGIYEIKNIATISFFQRQGYGKRLIQFLFEHYRGKCSELLVGTGDVPSTLSFYEHCGFTISHRLKNFFTDNYDHPIYEDGKQLVDMVYLKKTF